MRRPWTPEPLLRDRHVLVVGGGPSLRGFDWEQLRGQTVVVVNECALSVPWAWMLFFNDEAWYRRREEFVRGFGGHIVTSSHSAHIKMGERVRRLSWDMTKDRRTFRPKPPCLRWGPTSGHKAVSLCVAMRAERVGLLGFDCRLDAKGRSHGHDAYNHRSDRHMRESWLPRWRGWYRDALTEGTEIVNLTPNSALTEFPVEQLDTFLTSANRAWPRT